jgi:hypothetical protein
MNKTSIAEKFSLFSEHWRPKVVAQLNGQDVKLVKFKGEFVRHHHKNEDEMFLVWRGSFPAVSSTERLPKMKLK